MEKQNIHGESVLNANREHKSSVFSMLFSDPVVLRELYSAIEGVDLPPDIPIDINTLSDALIKGKQNDVSFTIGDRLVLLCEHQSTLSPNLTVRMLIYLGDIYKKIVNQKTVYKEKLVKIPTPEFIVLYNGVAPCDDYKELKLSDAFMDAADLKSPGKKTESLEMTVKVYNVNHGHNPQMMEKSETLNNYSFFIGKIREHQSEGMTLAEAVKSAIIYCTGNNILKDFLEEHGSEVINMLYQEYDLEEHLECRYEEGWEDGRENGITIGETRGITIGEARGVIIGESKGDKNRQIKTAQKMKDAGEPLSKIVEFTELSHEEIERI